MSKLSQGSSDKQSSHQSGSAPAKKSKRVEMNKVSILGGAGGIGQPLAMLLMHHPDQIHHIALYDLVDFVTGVGVDLSHIDRRVKVTTHIGPEGLAEAVRGSKVILVLAGLAQKPGMSRDDLFGSNAKIIYNITKVCAQTAPEAMLAIVSNPVNSLVPIACEVYCRLLCSGGSSGAPANTTTTSKSSNGRHVPGSFEDCHRRIFGVTTLDVVRAATLTAKSSFFKPEPNDMFKDPSKLSIPVVGGHAGKTIMPLLSQAKPPLDKQKLTEDKLMTSTLIDSIQQAGIDVLNAKKGKGSATLAMAYAACRFTLSLLKAMAGESNVVECAYVKHKVPVVGDLDYFSVPLTLGKDGYTKSLGIGKVLPFEQQMIEELTKELRHSIAKGEDFAKEHLSAEK